MQAEVININGSSFVQCGDFMLVRSGIHVYMYTVCEFRGFAIVTLHDLRYVSGLIPRVVPIYAELAKITYMLSDIGWHVRQHGEVPDCLTSELFFVMPDNKTE